MRKHHHSTKAVQLIQHCKETGEEIGRGTGFFCSFNGYIYLVTNHHVVSGHKPGTKKLIHSHGAVPGTLKFVCECIIGNMKEIGGDLAASSFERVSLNLPLFNDNDQPLWLEHPSENNACDVVAIRLNERELNNISEGAKFSTININRELDYNAEVRVMDNVFITGFPLNVESSLSRYPIYKAGFLASEPEDQHNGPKFYVDAKTKPGMSGSPVIQKEPMKITQLENGSWEATSNRLNFIGVYSGRIVNHNNDEHQAELGIVWPYKEYLIPILES